MFRIQFRKYDTYVNRRVMDDFTTSGLHESKNEWGARLLTILTPHIIDGFRSILEESVNLCIGNDEMDKYLMTFQNLIARIPKWNAEIVQKETNRIIEKSGCQYLEDLITCVHVIQLKILTSVRVGQKPKKVDIDIMNINDFIHKVYINSARQMYKNVYLFDINATALLKQKHNRELEIIVQECILNTVRDSIPVQTILRCYLDETTEENVDEEVKEEIVSEEKEESVDNQETKTVEDTTQDSMIGGDDVELPGLNVVKSDSVETKPEETGENMIVPDIPGLSFSNVDTAMDTNNNETTVNAPKDIDTLEKISQQAHEIRKQEAIDDDDGEDDKITISTEPVNLDVLDVHNINGGDPVKLQSEILNEIEILD